jgi:hypothetical protein
MSACPPNCDFDEWPGNEGYVYMAIGAISPGGGPFRAVGGVAGKFAKQGIYEFVASTGRRYVGQSANILRRLVDHRRSGKLLPRDLSTIRTRTVLGGKTTREIAEQTRINKLGGIENLENDRNPIGPLRQHLMP